MKSKKLIILFGIVSVLSKLAYGNTNFGDLPDGVKPFAKASVNISIYTDEKGGVRCTGIALSPTQILTSAHCLFDDDGIKKPILKVDIYSNPLSLFGSTLYEISAAEMTIDRNDYDPSIRPDDYAIITSNKLSKSNFVGIKNRVHDLTSYGHLVGNRIRFDNTYKMYIIGGASVGKFKWEGKSLSSVDNGFSFAQKLFTFDDIYTEEGDSGGPVILCDQNNSNCKLLGIIHKQIEGSNIFTGVPLEYMYDMGLVKDR